MGWLTYHRPKGESDLEHFRKELLGTRDPAGVTDENGTHRRIVDSATKNNVFYAALEITPPDRDPFTIAMVYLIFRGRGAHNFGYKSMTEDMGPVESECPARILDLLSPLDQVPLTGTSREWAAQWRERCRANLERATARPKVTAGDIVVFDKPWQFADRTSANVMLAVDPSRNRYARVVNTDTLDLDGEIVHGPVPVAPGSYRLSARGRWGDYRVIRPAS